MTRHDDFWQHVDAALDARTDPLDDPEVQQLVADDPSLLIELERLRNRLSSVDAPSHEPRVRRVAAIALVVAAASVVVWMALARRENTPTSGENVTTPGGELAPSHDVASDLVDQTTRQSIAEVHAELALTPRIFSFRSESSTLDTRGIRTVVFDGRTRTDSFVRFERPSDRSAPYISSFLAAASSLSNGN